MPNFKIIIEYEGTNYYGWQRQKTKVTVQEVIEKSIAKTFGKKISLTGQGRIDAGAHALAQTANFKIEKDFNVSNLKKALNSLLPFDIRIKDVQVSGDDFNARYSAKLRHYKYILYNGEPSVWLRKLAYFYPYKLEIKKMKEGAGYLIGEHDFSSFQSSGSPVKNSVRTVESVSITEKILNFPVEMPVIQFSIKANAFLYKMVRNIVGVLLEVGRGKVPPLQVNEILKHKDKRNAQTVPAYGLYLVGVEY